MKKNFSTSSKSTLMRCYDVNVRSVYASQPIGRLGLSKMCGIMNLPKPITKKPYNKIQKKKHSENSIKQGKKFKFSIELI